MSFSGFTGVAIGIVFLYLMLSLMCTVINEIVATVLKTRATFLAATIREIIDDPAVLAAFYSNGLISTSQAAANGPASGGAPQTTPKDTKHPSYFDAKNVAMAILASLSAADRAAPTQAGFPTMAAIEKLVGDMPDSALRGVLAASIATSQGELENLRDNIATWFDTAMDRLSGAYKRRTKLISIIVGFVLAAAVNADTYVVGKALWNDDTLRNQIVSTAGDVLKDGKPSGCTETDSGRQVGCLVDKLKTQDAMLRPLPLGWSRDDLPKDGGWPVFILGKLLAFIWTGLALSLGAPFWFDMLQNVMNLRGAGPNPAEKPS